MPEEASATPSEVTTPPLWSPGIAVVGTLTVKGTGTVCPACTVTSPCPKDTHVPTRSDGVPAGSRSSCPGEVVKASAAYTRNVSARRSCW